MKKTFIFFGHGRNCFLGVLLLVVFNVCTVRAHQLNVSDTLQSNELQEVEIISTRATASTPIAFTNLSKEQIGKYNHGQDLTYLMSGTPSVVTTSDAGGGIGYTTLRVRGTDGTRINVTVNGIPVNDAESHNVFWVNMPDLASSLQDVQIQRGAGTSTNGSGAFGASLNMRTTRANAIPYAEFHGSYGSFQTHKETFKVGTGLINDHWMFNARLSNIGTKGYIDRASVGMKSFYLQGGYYDENTSVEVLSFGGQEETYHAWNYASKEEMEQHNSRRYNSCGYMYTDEFGFEHFYDDQTDNYTQTHYQLLANHRFSPSWNLNVGLHYTKGNGYYQEYKTNRKLVEYGLSPFEYENQTVRKSDLIRKKAMDNGFGGGIFSLTFRNKQSTTTLGGGLNRYEGEHYGNVLWVKNYIGNADPNKEYYRNQGNKNDGNLYVKTQYEFWKGLSAYADLQYRHITYTINGTNDKWYGDAPQQLSIDKEFSFFNPKVGLNWQISPKHRTYASFSVAHKEPTRNNYTDGYLTQHPKAERLHDYELGYQYEDTYWHAGVNLYYMNYKDQLVLTGELNEIGEAVAANVPQSYRMGMELSAGLKLPCGLSWNANATLSRNRIRNFHETLYGYDEDWNELPPLQINHGSTHIAFSPEFIGNSQLEYEHKGFSIGLQSQYVSEQYMSNADVDAHKLDAYFVNNLHLSYTFKPYKLKSVKVGASIYNLFNEEYENNGWASSDYTGTLNAQGQPTLNIRNNYTGYAAQAGTHVMGHLSIVF